MQALDFLQEPGAGRAHTAPAALNAQAPRKVQYGGAGGCQGRENGDIEGGHCGPPKSPLPASPGHGTMFSPAKWGPLVPGDTPRVTGEEKKKFTFHASRCSFVCLPLPLPLTTIDPLGKSGRRWIFDRGRGGGVRAQRPHCSVHQPLGSMGMAGGEGQGVGAWPEVRHHPKLIHQ